MPIVGFGLWKVDNPVCAETVYQAIKAGYRLLDGACGMFYNSLATSAQNHLHPPPPPKKRIKKKKIASRPLQCWLRQHWKRGGRGLLVTPEVSRDPCLLPLLVIAPHTLGLPVCLGATHQHHWKDPSPLLFFPDEAGYRNETECSTATIPRKP
jgi:hypothetical protein